MDEKSQKTLNNYMHHCEKHIQENKKDFSSFNSIYNKVIKKSSTDHVFEYTKEIIKRMERDKLSSQIAMDIAENLMPVMQNLKKEVILMGLPMLIGFIILIISVVIFSFSRPFDLSNMKFVYSGIGIFIGGVLLGIGVVLRKKIKIKTLTNSMIFQASTAYGAAKMQGQGSFGAFRILEEMKNKQGKELKINLNQPKIIYKQR